LVADLIDAGWPPIASPRSGARDARLAMTKEESREHWARRSPVVPSASVLSVLAITLLLFKGVHTKVIPLSRGCKTATVTAAQLAKSG